MQSRSTILPQTALTQKARERVRSTDGVDHEADAVSTQIGDAQILMRDAKNLLMRAGLTCGASSVFALVFISSSVAGERTLPADAGQWGTRDKCAAYGPGFTSVAGTAACVRIGGHVRVEFEAHSLSYAFGNSHGPFPAAAHADDLGTSGFPEPRHLRVDSDDADGTIRSVEPASDPGRLMPQ